MISGNNQIAACIKEPIKLAFEERLTSQAIAVDCLNILHVIN